MKEIWKDITGLKGYYEASNLGNIHSKRTNTILKPSETGNKGYLKVGISIDNHINSYHVHRLVASAFIPNPENKRTVNHIDGNKLNNCVDNLEWNTYSENALHAYKLGLKDLSGIKNPASKLSEKDVREIKQLLLSKKYRQWEIALMYKVTRPNITSINNNKTWGNVI